MKPITASNEISRREFNTQLIRGLGGVALGAAGLAGARAAESGTTPAGAGAVTRRPNIMLIMSDQHAYKYCGFMGHPIVRTPNLDRIARQGVIFNNTYCGSPVCAPSRAGMVSGVYPSDCNSFCNATAWDGSLPPWPRLLRDAGYATFGTGKMDVHDKFDLGFEVVPYLANQHWKNPDITAFFRRPLCYRPGERALITGRPRKERHGDRTTAGYTIDFIRKQVGSGKPWAAYLGPHMPHEPFVGLEEHYRHYLPRVDLPNNPPGHLESQHEAIEQLRNYKDLRTLVPEDRIRTARAAYYAMITELDEYIGQVWAALEETGQLENTIFVYTSDHGESLGEHGLWLKNNLYDVAARVPFIMAGPGIPAGKVVETPVAHVDLIRTLLETGGARLPEKLRGHSLVPLMRGEAGDHPGWAYTESHSEGNCAGSFMIRKGDWKYLHYTWYEPMLFNLAEDPGEFTNLAGDPEARPKLEELRSILLSQVDPVEVTDRAFRVQRKRMDAMAAGLTEEKMVDAFRSRLGEGQAVTLLGGYYGRPVHFQPKPVATGSGGADAG